MHRLPLILISLGISLILASLIIFLVIFYPVIKNELNYAFYAPSPIEIQRIQNEPVDKEFGIVVPKINANSKVIRDVNAMDSRIYQQALTKGVAHAKGSSYPGDGGNVFLFSHSSVDFYEANRYNSIFYLLSKLEKDDDVFIYFEKKKIKYKVKEKKVVDPKDISYLSAKSSKERLTLMTCWPAGTNLKRLIIIAEPSS